MSSPDYLQQYLSVLRIRETAARRNAMFASAVFAACLLVALVWSLMVPEDNRSLFLGTGILIVLGLGVASTWSRVDTLKGMAELVDELCAVGERSDRVQA